jgi:histone H3/H4
MKESELDLLLMTRPGVVLYELLKKRYQVIFDEADVISKKEGIDASAAYIARSVPPGRYKEFILYGHIRMSEDKRAFFRNFEERMAGFGAMTLSEEETKEIDKATEKYKEDLLEEAQKIANKRGREGVTEQDILEALPKVL